MPDLKVALSEAETGAIILRFPDDIDPQRFIFMVNYLHYPEHLDLKHRLISARGTCVLTSEFQLPDPKLIGARATFFVPADDTEYDVVLVATDSGDTYRIPFTNLRWQLVSKT
jgi:hypothetical protein